MLWAVKLEDDEQTIVYTGELLEPGNIYYWRVFDSTSNESSFSTVRETFRVMDVQKVRLLLKS